MSRGARVSLLGLTAILAMPGCKADEPEPPPGLRYAYVVAEPGATCGQIKLFTGEGEFGESEPEAINWDAGADQCQTRPVFGNNTEFAWLTHEVANGTDDTWQIKSKRSGESTRTLRQLTGVVDIGRLAWSPTGDHLAVYFQEPGQPYYHGLYDAAPSGLSNLTELGQIAYADDLIEDVPGREMRVPSFSANGKRYVFPTYENMDNSVPRFNLDVAYTEAHDDNGGFAEGHFTFDGIVEYDRIRQVVFGSRDDVVFAHGQLPDGTSHVLRIDVDATRTATLLYEGGDADHWFGPLEVSPDGEQVLFLDHEGQVVIVEASGAVQILGVPKGDPLSWIERNLRWVGNERVSFTVLEGNKHIEMFDRSIGQVIVVAQEEGKDVMDLAWDPNRLGRVEGASDGSGSSDGSSTDSGGTDETTGM